ncbi:ATP-binding protein [Paraburkholderia sp. SARCC-3016]|uniref:ATP-binding protein n=1 Tax=Paraburkholderia sp. SARCC-3016 TaxID=3058611 RepID=UPI0028097736|nr:ATP-binding protein [Paraburkholderia sp. SARCC-3016]MDQ7976086.1 ATP-binding protein [Paraburkholderia sp. SARCC-3016]
MPDLYRASDAVRDLLRVALAHTGGRRIVLVNVSLKVQLVEAEAALHGGEVNFYIGPRAVSEVDDLPAFAVETVVKAKRQLVIDEPSEIAPLPRHARAASMRGSLLCLPVTSDNRVVCALLLMGDTAKKIGPADRYALEKIAEYAFTLLHFPADAEQTAGAMATRAEISLNALRREMSDALRMTDHHPATLKPCQEEDASAPPHGLPVGARWLDRGEPDHRSAQTGLWNIVQQSGQAMSVISELRGSTGRSNRRRVLFDLNDAVVTVLAALRAHIETPDIRFVVENGESCETSITGDRHLISLALLQIFRNALDTLMTVQGRARTLTVRYENPDANRLQVDISDTGAGVAGATIAAFRPFATNRPGKLGLGMALCKSIVELHEGSIDIFTNQPYGSTVRMYLPFPEEHPDTC